MNLGKFVEGVDIIRKYYKDSDGFHLGADHDIIYLYATQKAISPDDVTRLRELGWFQPDAEDDGDGDWIYDPEHSWAAYT